MLILGRSLAIAFTLLLAALAVRQSGAAPRGADALVGTWRLISFENWDAAGNRSVPYGEHPSGYFVYDPTGHLSVQVMRTPPLAPFASGTWEGGTVAEKEAAFDAYLAYYGTYTVDVERGVVVHHVEGALSPSYTHTDQPRPFVLRGDTLVISDPKRWKRVLERVR
jgi:hypothetical protein